MSWWPSEAGFVAPNIGAEYMTRRFLEPGLPTPPLGMSQPPLMKPSHLPPQTVHHPNDLYFAKDINLPRAHHPNEDFFRTFPYIKNDSLYTEKSDSRVNSTEKSFSEPSEDEDDEIDVVKSAFQPISKPITLQESPDSTVPEVAEEPRVKCELKAPSSRKQVLHSPTIASKTTPKPQENSPTTKIHTVRVWRPY